MSTATLATPPKKLLTTADLLAMPGDEMERWLIDGHLREKPTTKRNRFHSRIMSKLCYFLEDWLERQPLPRGEVLSGEAGVTLRKDPDTSVGIDVVYVSAEVAAMQNDESTLVVGVPALVVEILSPSDTTEEIDEKTDKYLAAGVTHVWIVDPHDRTVLVHRPGELPELFNVKTELDAEPQLPGFRLSVSRIFE